MLNRETQSSPFGSTVQVLVVGGFLFFMDCVLPIFTSISTHSVDGFGLRIMDLAFIVIPVTWLFASFLVAKNIFIRPAIGPCNDNNALPAVLSVAVFLFLWHSVVWSLIPKIDFLIPACLLTVVLLGTIVGCAWLKFERVTNIVPYGLLCALLLGLLRILWDISD